MKVYIDHQKVNARAQGAQFASVGGLLLLLASVLIPLFLPGLADFSWILLVFGLGMAMVGIYFANRWVRKPRPEDSLDNALKSFDDRHHLYHYPSLPCSHILLTPTGLIAMEVVNIGSVFSYRNGKWKEAMTIGRALRYIVEERVEDPVKFSQEMIQVLTERVDREFNGALRVPIKALTVFTHPTAILETEGTAVPFCRIEKLRKQVAIQSERMAPETYERLSLFLERLTIV